MPKSLYSAPEEFAVSPLLFLLPARSQVSKLKSLYSSLFARHEKVSQQLEESRELERAGAENKSLISEELMLSIGVVGF